MSQSNSSGDAFQDSLNFVKNLWGQMAVPGMPGMPGMASGMALPTPSMSVEDLDKRIHELKTVETWLNVNMTMLRNTIQALEVQRATIATLHSLSTTMVKTMQGGSTTSAADAQESSADVADSPLAQSAAWWQGVQDQFKVALGTALEKSAANFAAAQSATEEIVKSTLTPDMSAVKPTTKPAAAKKVVRKPAARKPAARKSS